MARQYKNTKLHYAYEILKLGVRNQILLSRALDLKNMLAIKELKQIDKQLVRLLMECKQAGRLYIWHTQGDDKVRPEHAANDG